MFTDPRACARLLQSTLLTTLTTLTIFIATSVGAASDAGVIWVEGEDAVAKDVAANPWYAEAIKKDQLSGGAWLSSFGGDHDGSARYDLTIDKAGDYTLWVRANPVASALSYQLDSAAAVEIDTAHAIDVVNLAADDKPDLRFLGWMNAGALHLKAGAIHLTFRFHSANNHHGAIDCFALSSTPFTPSGARRPGQKLASREPGWFAFDPDSDDFAKDSEFALRALNEKIAGEHGFIAAKGDDFALGDGKPVRFWAANTGAAACDLDDQSQDAFAATLAKRGFNLVRIHGSLSDRANADPTNIDHKRLARYQRLVGAFKKQGIYVELSTYFPLWMALKASDGVPGAALGKNPFALLYFEPHFQDLYKAWAEQMLTTKDLVTGLSLAQEPAVALWEIVNEDSLFFWTFSADALGPGPWALLEERFTQYLMQHYGSVAKAEAAWPGEVLAGDSPSHVALYRSAWDMTRDGIAKGGHDKRKRVTDQIDFLAKLQHDAYADLAAWLRKECGLKCPIVASNWQTADPGLTGGIERWTYSAADVIDRHGYFGGAHTDGGDGSAGWSVRAGHHYSDACALLDPAAQPYTYFQLSGHPHIQSELAWNKPNRFIAEGDLMASTFASLWGSDGLYWFVAGSGAWETGGNGVWTLMMPGEIGQSPATALQFRRGDVARAKPVIRQVVPLTQLLALDSSGMIEGANADFRVGAAPQTDDSSARAIFDPYAYFAGRVERTSDAATKPIAEDLTHLIDRTAKRIISNTGEIAWRYGEGLIIVDSPRSQACAGYLAKADTIALSAVTIASSNEYGAIHVISLDGQPLVHAKRMLIQAFTEEKMSGFAAHDGVIADTGHAPILVREITATVTFTGATHLTATALDGNGYPMTEAVAVNAGTVTLPKDALYTLVVR